MKGKEAACDGRCLLRVVHLTALWVHQHKQFVHKFRFLVSAAVIFKDINGFSFCLMFYRVSTGVFGKSYLKPTRLGITSALTACRAASSILPHLTSPGVKGQGSDSHG